MNVEGQEYNGSDVQEDPLTSFGYRLLLFDLNLDDFGRMQDDLADVGTMSSSDLSQDPFVDVCFDK